MKIDSELLELLWDEAEDSSPCESFGILWRSSNSQIVDTCTNYPGPLFEHRFEPSPDWLLQTHMRARGEGLDFAGYYHSHPLGSRLQPSKDDIAGHPLGSYGLIVGLDPRRARLFHFTAHGPKEVGINNS